MKGNLVFFFLLGVADLVRSAEEVFAEGPRAQNKNINNVDELRLALSEEMRRQDQKFAEWEKRRLEEIRKNSCGSWRRRRNSGTSKRRRLRRCKLRETSSSRRCRRSKRRTLQKYSF